MRDLVHQLAKRAALEVDHSTVVATFEIDIVLTEKLPVDDRSNAVGLAQRRDGADLAIREQALEFVFGGEANRLGQERPQAGQRDLARGRNDRQDEALPALDDNGFCNGLFGNVRCKRVHPRTVGFNVRDDVVARAILAEVLVQSRWDSHAASLFLITQEAIEPGQVRRHDNSIREP